MLSCSDLSISYGPRKALDGFTISLAPARSAP